MELNLDLTTTPLNKVIHRMALFFVGTFAVACVAVAVYEVVWAIPSKRCAEHNGWWDPGQRVCGTPVFLPNFTHRAIGAPKITPLSR